MPEQDPEKAPEPDSEAAQLQSSLVDSPLPDMTESMDLVVKAQGGDDQALNDLLGRYWPRLQRVARIRLGARLRKHVDSGDIVAETMGTVIKGDKIKDLELRSPASILQWLSRIAENKIRDVNDYLTAQKRDSRREVPLDSKPGDESRSAVELDLTASDESPVDQAFRSELRDLLEEAMVRLSDDHREVIVARDHFGGSWEYVAEHVGRAGNVHATQELHRRAWEKLTGLLKPKLGDSGGEE